MPGDRRVVASLACHAIAIGLPSRVSSGDVGPLVGVGTEI